jgi:WD40 repeat protein
VTDNQHAVVELWDTTTGDPVPADATKLGNEPNFAKEEVGPSVAFARDKALLALNRGSVIRLCEPPWYTEIGPAIRAAVEPKTLALSPDGSFLAAGVGGAVELWDTATRARRATFTGHKGSVLALAFSADGRTLYSGASMDTVVRIWKLPAPV